MDAEWISLNDLFSQYPGLLDVLEDQDIILHCRNTQTGAERSARFSALFRNNSRFWEAKNWDFFLSRGDREILIDLMNKKANKIRGKIEKIHIPEKMNEALPPSFGKEYQEISSMSLDDREKRIAHSIVSLDEALGRPHVASHELADIMTDAAIYSTLINKVSMEEMEDQEDRLAQRYLIQINSKTEELMGSFLKALSGDHKLNHTNESITNQTKGVTTRHMTRVFLLTIRFLDDLRHQFEYAGLYQRLQSRMRSYLPLYEPLRSRYPLKKFDASVVFPVSPRFSDNLMEEIMLGILLHDLGKNKNLLYFDGAEDYDRKIIEGHAFDGYFMLMKKSAYRQPIASLAGLHHEYYGHPQGYGVFRDLYEEHRKKHSGHQFACIMSCQYEDLVNYRSLAYMPAKILEIVDVYDALIDKDRLYKAPMSPLEALSFMRKTMIDNDLKLDPIFFDLFVKFLNKAKLL